MHNTVPFLLFLDSAKGGKSMTILIDGHSLTLKQVGQIACSRVPVALAHTARQAMEASRNYVLGLIEQQKVVYGITTGFGKFSDLCIESRDVAKLQHNLVRSHACGVGPPLAEEEVRAMLLLRANALALGYSGVRPCLADVLLECINKNILPVIPSKGSLGASGDLVPLAHAAMFLIGEGEATYRGERMSAEAALKAGGLEPVQLAAKEGLALINGTQFMAARGAMLLLRARKLALAADGIAALSCQALRGIPAAFSPLVGQVRNHPGQQQSAANLCRFLKESKLTSAPGELRTQDAYALRCIPQIHGASLDAFDYAATVIGREINAATDNPLIFPQQDEVISGGNFHGQPLALVLDYLAIALAELASIAERRIERLVNPQLNNGLPPFLTDKGGLNSGLMILQYVAAALTSENKVLSHPASVDSIPSSGNQEDHVSMGANAANKAWQICNNLQQVLAIELICACQALDFRGPNLLSPIGREIYRLVRRHVDYIACDRSMHNEIKLISGLLAQDEISAILEEKE